MEKSNFEDLQVFQLSEKLADIIWNIVIHWEALEKDTVGKQIIRAADSIGANIAEGTGRHNFQDNQRFVKIARGSLHETRYWLRRAYTRKLLTTEQIDKLKPILDELSPKLNAYLKYLETASKNNKRSSTNH
ncbi:four helix bundle protein [Scytonema sp. UIC 10036]|uniref:four helix bundle protein n=1 Tax=Scytonema sp. UIC 10036 TaxID=2304196 RepID=UPI0012DAD965|nr:four helix bundle protein [Scytonema sp. UIC 10036]MUH01668.1 four helix bundle protein [Scytonema sp. UIC 10036]